MINPNAVVGTGTQGDDSKTATGKQEDDLFNFLSDEEYEDPNSQKEDMKTYLNNLAERIDNLVKSLMDAKEFVGTQTSERIIRQQLEAREGLRDKDGKQVNIAEYFNNLVQQEQWKLLRYANLEFK